MTSWRLDEFLSLLLMLILTYNIDMIDMIDDNSEFLVVDIEGNFSTIRTINCYGPQENLPLETRSEFFIELETRIVTAKSSGKLVCVECDANSKLGKQFIKGDPHEISQNGKLLLDLVTRQNLIVVNSTEKCFGTITRMKKTTRGTEQSVIDYFIVCEELFESVEKMQIDEERKFTLSRFYKTKNKTSVIESDHNILTLYLRLKWNPKNKMERKEIYNLRNSECQEIFRHNTTNNHRFIEVLKHRPVDVGGSKWLKELKHQISKSFKKIRFSSKCPKIDKAKNDLFCKREKLKCKILNPSVSKDDHQNAKLELVEIEEEIAEYEANENFKNTVENVKYLVDNTENLNSIKMWELKKKLCKKKPEAPTAKRDLNGKIVTKVSDLKELYEHTYKNRLKHRPMKPHLKIMYKLKWNCLQ